MLWIFFISFVLVFIALLWVLFIVKEKMAVESGPRYLGISQACKEIFKTASNLHQSSSRSIFWVTLLALACFKFTSDGPDSIPYLFTRNKFGWNAQDFALLASFSLILNAIGAFGGIWLLKRAFTSSNLMIAVYGFASGIISSVFLAMTAKPRDMYTGTVFGLLQTIPNSVGRSILANICLDGDLGKINAIIVVMETLVTTIAAPTYTFFYSLYIKSFPSGFSTLR